MICPIMSRPQDRDPVEDERDEKYTLKMGFTIIEGIPWMNIFECQHEKCMAWNPPTRCKYFDECDKAESEYKYKNFRIRCQEINGSGKCMSSAFCRLIGKVIV